MASVTEIHSQAEQVRPLRFQLHERAPVQGARDLDWTEYLIEQQLVAAHDAQSNALLAGLRSDIATEVSILLDLADETADYLVVGPRSALERSEQEYAAQLTRVARLVRGA